MKLISMLLILFCSAAHADVDISIINNTIIVEIDGQKAYIPIDKEDINQYNSDAIVEKACKVLRCKNVKHDNK